jgi:hypothetical protein
VLRIPFYVIILESKLRRITDDRESNLHQLINSRRRLFEEGHKVHWAIKVRNDIVHDRHEHTMLDLDRAAEILDNAICGLPADASDRNTAPTIDEARLARSVNNVENVKPPVEEHTLPAAMGPESTPNPTIDLSETTVARELGITAIKNNAGYQSAGLDAPKDASERGSASPNWQQAEREYIKQRRLKRAGEDEHARFLKSQRQERRNRERRLFLIAVSVLLGVALVAVAYSYYIESH